MKRISRAFLALTFLFAALATTALAQYGVDNRQYETVVTDNGVTLQVPVVSTPSAADLLAVQQVKQTFLFYPVAGFSEDKPGGTKALNFSDLTIGEHKAASNVRFDLPNGWPVFVHYYVKRTGVFTWWAYVELGSTPGFTIPGGPWLRGSQIVWIGDIHGTCGEGPMFRRVIDKSQGGNEIGWLDASTRGKGANGGDGVFHKNGYYPEPGSQDVADDGMTFRWFGLYDMLTPGGERIGWVYGAHVIDEARRSNLYLLQFQYSVICQICRSGPMVTRDMPRRIEN